MSWSFLAALTLAADPSLAGLDTRLAPLAEAHKGEVAIAVKHLITGETYFLNADRVMPTASLIKVAVMLEVYHQADEGKIRLTDHLTMREEDKVPGSGLLTTHFSGGTTFSIHDAVHLMMAVSDNTATNLLLDRVGIANVNKRMEGRGLKETRINSKVFRGSTTVDPRALEAIWSRLDDGARDVSIAGADPDGRPSAAGAEAIGPQPFAGQRGQGEVPAFPAVQHRGRAQDRFGEQRPHRRRHHLHAERPGDRRGADGEEQGPALGGRQRRQLLLCARVAQAVYEHYRKASE